MDLNEARGAWGYGVQCGNGSGHGCRGYNFSLISFVTSRSADKRGSNVVLYLELLFVYALSISYMHIHILPCWLGKEFGVLKIRIYPQMSGLHPDSLML